MLVKNPENFAMHYSITSYSFNVRQFAGHRDYELRVTNNQNFYDLL